LQAELWQGLRFGLARGIAVRLNQCPEMSSEEIGTLTWDAAAVVAVDVDDDVVAAVGGVVNAAMEKEVACCLDYSNSLRHQLH